MGRNSNTLSQKPPATRKRKGWSLQQGETLAGFLFVSPMLIGVIVLVLIPIIATMVLSFADWNFVQGFDGIHWIGFENFRKLFDDDMFIKSVRNNFLFLLTVPIYMLVSMVLAVLI
ncbi:MAG: sugar ABC transporter permease, partial [Gorillibacterium sp.]|nr:sugar ABC transporter permease [Gorillibacterium sp.]